jgi:hypothetical protein
MYEWHKIAMSDVRQTKYWLVIVSKDHLETGKKLGIVQANHGGFVFRFGFYEIPQEDFNLKRMKLSLSMYPTRRPC